MWHFVTPPSCVLASHISDVKDRASSKLHRDLTDGLQSGHIGECRRREVGAVSATVEIPEME